jgi:hypothetical protein
MGATGKFKHVASASGALAIANVYTTSLSVTLQDETLIQSSIFVDLTTIAGGATKTTIRITSDAAGDVSLVPDTEAVLSLGIATATKGSSVYKTDVVVPAGSKTVYVWAKLDAGTAILAKVTVTGTE